VLPDTIGLVASQGSDNLAAMAQSWLNLIRKEARMG
jgi:hypothetical protein